MKKHWTVETTSYRMPRDHTPLALIHDPTPGGVRNEAEGTTSYSLRFPALILTDIVSDGEKIANKIANELNMAIALATPRPLSEWHEDMGDVLWWCWTPASEENGGKACWAGEPPYVGTPLDCGITVEAHVRLISQMDQEHEPEIVRRHLGGWPGYHTHFTPLPPLPSAPK